MSSEGRQKIQKGERRNANENDEVKAMKIDEARGNMRKGPFARIQSGEYFEDEKPDTKFFPADKKPKIEVKPEIPLKEEQVIQSIAEISDQELDAEDFERRAESHAKYQKALDLDQGDDDEEEKKEAIVFFTFPSSTCFLPSSVNAVLSRLRKSMTVRTRTLKGGNGSLSNG